MARRRRRSVGVSAPRGVVDVRGRKSPEVVVRRREGMGGRRVKRVERGVVAERGMLRLGSEEKKVMCVLIIDIGEMRGGVVSVEAGGGGAMVFSGSFGWWWGGYWL